MASRVIRVRLELEVLDYVVVLVLIPVMDDVIRRNHLPSVLPPDDVMLVAVSAAVANAWVGVRRNDQDVRPVAHLAIGPLRT